MLRTSRRKVPSDFFNSSRWLREIQAAAVFGESLDLRFGMSQAIQSWFCQPDCFPLFRCNKILMSSSAGIRLFKFRSISTFEFCGNRSRYFSTVTIALHYFAANLPETPPNFSSRRHPRNCTTWVEELDRYLFIWDIIKCLAVDIYPPTPHNIASFPRSRSSRLHTPPHNQPRV